ncbi:MAG: phospholipase D-like domain-containing protein [Candidatus Woesearchaeota archaeon]|nr:phospholipase D-like domain-containing protein [Candidatus Woesearchaeota archaeon]
MKKLLVFSIIVLIFISGCGLTNTIRTDSKVNVYFCPEDNCKEHVMEVINSANSSVLFMTYSFTDNDIGDLLIKKYQEGVKVKGIFERSQESKYSEYNKLKNNKIDVKFDKNEYYMHNKIFVIDEKIVITGSYNPTRNGDENNNENLVIIYDEKIAKQYVDEFNKLF